MTELAYVTYLGIGSKHDDALDIISQLSQMTIRIPANENLALPLHNKDFDNRYWDAEVIEEDEGSSYIF